MRVKLYKGAIWLLKKAADLHIKQDADYDSFLNSI